MARIRTIKPEFWSDERVGECSGSARLLLLGMLNFSDDFGNIERSARQLKAQIFPYDNIDCEPLVQELLKVELIREYEANGSKFINIKNFLKHQCINHPSNPRCPLHPSQVALPEGSGSPSVVLSPEGKGREGTRKGMEGNGREGKKPSVSSPAAPAPSGPVVVELPLNTGEMFPIHESQVKAWEKAYPAVNVRQELREIRAWDDSNPTRRKTRGGILRHVTNWLSGEQDRGPRQRPDRAKPVPSENSDYYTRGLKQNSDGSYKL